MSDPPKKKDGSQPDRSNMGKYEGVYFACFNQKGQEKTHPSFSVFLVMESSYVLPVSLLRFN